jgi:ABC-2 type transport system ATP-binding protein
MALVRRSAFHDDATTGRTKRAFFAGFFRWQERSEMTTILEQTRGARTAEMVSTAASLDGVSKNYGSVKALRNVNFAVHPGEVIALLGPNGAGKTTAVKLLLGLMQPNSGKVRVLGGDPTNPENRTRTGAMLQIGRVPETLRVREHIDLFSSYYPNPLALEEVIAAAGLEKFVDRKFGDLSGGQRQRVLFALAICGNPDLLFLDEPTVGLDVESRRALWEEIRKLVDQRKTVLLTTHYLEEADALADRIAVINEGAIIAEGTPSEIKAKTSGKRIRCVTRLEVATLRQIRGVAEVKADREAVEIHAIEAEPVVRELLARDSGLSGLEVTSAGLEEAFLALTQDDGRGGKSEN